ncbi:MAG TPA: superoxide dismutase family protein [Luteimonas sp.]|nr:superoxide dismutase family protein [Luteimonas sp.]
MSTIQHRHHLLAIAAACALAACASTGEQAAPAPAPQPAAASTAQSATVNLASASGSIVSGKLSIVPMGDGVHITGEVGGLGAGQTHAIHVHEKGDCSAVDASSAGGHFNPTGSAHGRAGTPVHHAGDMDNIVADADGVAKIDIHLSGVTLGGGAANDIAGRAVIVHAAPDDYTSQPSGNAGARVACGVVTPTM